MEEEQDGNHINIKQEGTTGGQNVEEETNPKKRKINWESLDSSLISVTIIKTLVKVKVTQSCLTLFYPMDCNLPVSSVLGILQDMTEYWSGLPFTSPGDLPNPGMEPRSPALQADSLLSEPSRKPIKALVILKGRQGR